ncbi:MAG TPA: metalloregulator ArsR/SmtB family transcription factor [Acidimicrobiia bacterium]|jgi:DNA-binding transcriptional ArsR family regulator|nr:metalloregulator ArsR/SmtB family transcription factor [Acidimicrobiia bacterium]
MPDIDSAFRALADPTRRRIIELVALRGMTAGDIASQFETTRPAVSQHVAILRNAGLVAERREGRTRIYQANPQAMDEVVQHLQSFWAGRLQELKRQAEREARHQRG